MYISAYAYAYADDALTKKTSATAWSAITHTHLICECVCVKFSSIMGMHVWVQRMKSRDPKASDWKSELGGPLDI